MSEIVIRKAKKSDAAKIADLSVQLEHPMTDEEAGERLAVVLRDENQALFVAQEKSQVIGYVSVSANFEFLNGVQARLGGLVVGSVNRGKGIGKRLMKEAEKWAKAKGIKSMKLASNVKRIDAHRFYEKIGYIKTKEQAAFKKDL